ncbi:MAG TPA: methyltransferase domain-containing protein [Chthoniobacteraceae bacterium]|jgi:SAM-dependent methyltransferase
MKRIFNPEEPELMDRPQPVSSELEADLLNLVSLNRNFGGHRLVRSFLPQWLESGRCYRVLDLATGAGDIPRLMVDWARPREITLRIDAVDANPSTIEIARKHSEGYDEIEFLVGNALRFGGSADYDLVCCSLAVHHFSEEDAVRLLCRCRDLSTRFVLVADLERSPATSIAIYALTALAYTEPMTQADARASAQRAFSFGEFRALAESARWRNFGHARFLFCRQALWLDGRDLAAVTPEVEIAVAQGLPCPAA